MVAVYAGQTLFGGVEFGTPDQRRVAEHPQVSSRVAFRERALKQGVGVTQRCPAASDAVRRAGRSGIVIEGLFALYDADLRKMMSLKIFVDTAPDVRFIRRLQRDIAERGRSTENVIQQYLETVRPMHKQFIEPTKRRADVILPHGANGPAVDIITTKVVNVIRDLDRS